MNEVFDIKNEEDFQTKVLESKKPVIVDPDVAMFSPILTDIVDGRYGNMDLTEVNIDNEFQTQ